MRRYFPRLAITAATLLIGLLIGFVCGQSTREKDAAAEAAQPAAAASEKKVANAEKKPQRYGAVIGVKRETLQRYIDLHKATWPTVLKRINSSNIRNYSICLGELDDGNLYLFAYYEYTGNDHQADMQKMAADPETQRWWKETDPLQIPQKNRKKGEHWMTMREVFHTD
jgi:L-rhamnose mutarotase